MSTTGYSTLQIGLHWSVALLIVLQISTHEAILILLDKTLSGKQPGIAELIFGRAHVVLGLSVFVLGLVRLGVRVRQGTPAHRGTALQVALVKLSHFVLYSLILFMPISGALAWFGEIEFAARVHSLMKYVLIAFVVLHFAGAAYHYFLARDGVAERIVRPERK